MTPERWREVTQIYGAVVSRAPEQRAAAVAELCGSDQELRREIESLLESQHGASLLDKPASDRGSVMQMVLPIGSQIGVFRIDSLLGVGGMGEVYRARDTKLNRDVAIKILPPAFANDPDRLARFKREAQVLASINHPNIATIHGFEDSSLIHALVLELIEGPTLADRIARGRLPVDEAIAIAKQIADALEAAHEQGIVHRDLKPANIKVRDDGTVKVLDFGLAKIAESPVPSPQSPVVSQSPTITTPAMTQAGMILGTAAYMSPEQAKARPADKRSDIWAFGCVLYEMLTGKRAFEGEDVSDTLANILKAEPIWSALPSNLPYNIRDILDGCLQKDRKQRIGDFSTIRFLLNRRPSDAARPATSRQLFPMVLTGGVAIAAITLMAAGAWRLARVPAQRLVEPTRLEIVPPRSQPLAIQGVDRDIAISADGRSIAYRAGQGLQQQLFVRRMDQLTPQALAGTSNVRAPFFSPDGKWVGFWKEGVFYKISVTGGPPIPLCQPSGPPRGASWGDDNMIVVATNDPETGLLRIPASGGDLQVLTKPDVAQHETDHQFPFVMPGSRAVLFTILSADAASTRVAVLDLKTGQQKTVLANASQAEYADGYLVYAAGGALRAIQFDPNRLEVVGDPLPVSDQVLVSMPARALGAANFTLSYAGTLLYVPAEFAGQVEARSLIWVDRNGHQEPLAVPPRPYLSARLSPDDTQVALEGDLQNDISILDLARPNASPRRLTFDRGQNPTWTPDGKSIIFASARTGAPNIFRRAVDGSGADERLTTGNYPQFVDAIASNGVAIGFEVVSTQYLTLFSLQSVLGLDKNPARTNTESTVSRTAIQGLNSRLSPDGRYVAYQSSESGTGGFEIYVRPFPNLNAGKWQISAEGGARPVWSRDGSELFYFHRRLPQVMRVVTHTSGAFSFETPMKMFDWPTLSSIPPPFDVSRAGRFLMIKENTVQATQPASPNLVLVDHWTQELRMRAASK